mgnify:FL=1
MKWLSTLYWMSLFLLVVLFSIQNRDSVALRFGIPFMAEPWLETPKVPVFLVFISGLLLGLLVSGFSDVYRRYQLKRTLRQNRNLVEELRKEIDALRGSLPRRAPFPQEDL